MSEDNKTVWIRIDGKKPRKEAVLVGRIISREWLAGSQNVTRVHLTGDLRSAFSDLIEAAKDIKKNLPVVSLRAGLACRIDGVIALDTNIGLIADKKGNIPAAAKLFTPDEDDLGTLRTTIASTIKRWVIDDVEVWAEDNGLGHLAERLRDTVNPLSIDLESGNSPFLAKNGYPDFALIAHTIGQRLVGEELFAGLGNCELVVSTEYSSNSVELMTLPKRASSPERDDVYSMVARLSVSTVPYSAKDVFLSVTATKRVWAKQPPVILSRAARNVTAYVMTVGRPAAKVNVVKTVDGWEFGEEYATLLRESQFQLPETLGAAIQQRVFNTDTGWWAGLPELPSLYRSVSPRTVFEGDEISLLNTVSDLLDPIVHNKPIPIREVKLPVFPAKPRLEMLKLSDFGVAGAVFNEEGEDDDDELEEQDSSTREERLERYREQNKEVLRRVHDDVMPIVWVLSNFSTESSLIEKTVSVLFGDAVAVNSEPLPARTHGLRSELDTPEGKAVQRFDARVKCWQSTADNIRRLSGKRPIIVLICAPDRVGKKPEDSVNYYAGIHAMSKIGANVHHVLPIENPDNEKSKQNFLHRAQSALLDVILAHSGAVIGVNDFIDRLHLPQNLIPKAIYGIQAVRSRSQFKSGQSNVNFILYSRVNVENGMTEVRIGYRDSHRNSITPWMTLSAGLAWLGSQRRLQDGDSIWLKNAFFDLTRQALSDFYEGDPNAIVMLEWDSLRNLWRGISDADLGLGNHPHLNSIDLTRFPNMTFVRLRRGIDTISLRSTFKATYKGWRESGGVRVDTGEIKHDEYVTTDKRLVEIADEVLPEARSFGHYIASMGYTKTVQMKRGFSCYRPMPRMVRLGKGASEFEQKVLDVASMDASLPAPMDVTVMQAPTGVNPRVYATLTMGLRLGYAHHNDWTTLPMPLFFRRKIEDYIIRYPDEEDEPEIDILDAVTAETTEQDAVPTFFSVDVIKEVEGVAEEKLPVDESTPDVVGFTPALSEDTDLLKQFKQIEMPAIHAHQDYQGRQLYRRMLNGDARVRVQLPYWLKTRNILSFTGELTRRKVRRSWDRLIEFGYVKNGVKMPSFDEYANWLSEKLFVPQYAATLISVTREIGQVNFAPMVRIIEEEYNPTHPDDPVNPYAISIEMFEALTQWACDKQHDELLGWLVFMSAQLPDADWNQKIVDNVVCVPGPRTRHALSYYLATASAIQEVLEHKGKHDHMVVLRDLPAIDLTLPNGSKVEPQEAPPVFSYVEPTVAETGTLNTPSAQEIQVQEGDLVMTIKKTLIQLIESIEPGEAGFESTMQQIHDQVSALTDVHAKRQAIREASALLAEKMATFVERQRDVANQINALQEDTGIEHVSPRPIAQDQIESASGELTQIKEAIGDLSALMSRLQEIGRMPTPSNLQERAKRQQVETQIVENAMARANEMKTKIQQGICFDFIKGGGTPPEGEDDQVSDLSSSTPMPTVVSSQDDHSKAEPTPELVLTPLIATKTAQLAFPAFDQQDQQDTKQAQSATPEPVQMEHTKAGYKTSPTQTPDAVSAWQSGNVATKESPISLAIHTTLGKTEPSSTLIGRVPSEMPAPLRPVLEMLGPSQMPKVEEADTDLEAPLDTRVFDEQVPVLRKLLNNRLYGLANVHVNAIGKVIEGIGDQEIKIHHVILNALVSALDAMDCEFTFDKKLDPSLNELLTAEQLPSGPIFSPAPMALGILAAGLSNMLFGEKDVLWRIGNAVSARLSGHSTLHSLVEHLDQIRVRGYILSRDLFVRSRIGDKVAIEAELARFRKRAAEWKKAPEIHSTFNHRGFLRVHEHIYGAGHPIGKCLMLISKGETHKVEAAYEEARRLFEKAQSTVETVYREIGEKTKPDGLYRNQAVENIEITEQFVLSYLEQVKRRDTHSADLTRDVQSFLDQLNIKLRDAIKEVQNIQAASELESLYCDAAIRSFRCTIKLFDADEPAACIPDNAQRLLIQLPLGKDQLPVMNAIDEMTPPLCSPDDVFDQVRHLAEENLTLDDPKSESYIDQALADAYQGHLSASRFLPAFMISLLPGFQFSKSGQKLQDQYAKERYALVNLIQETRQKVAHAMTLSALSQEETDRMQWLIEELLALCNQNGRSIGKPEGESALYCDFPQARAALRSNVIQPLETRLSENKGALEIELDAEEAKGTLPHGDINRIRSMLESSNAATLRTAHDALAMLRQSGKLPAKAASQSNVADAYEEFIHTVRTDTGSNKQLLNFLLERLSVIPDESDPEWLAALNAEQRQDSIEFIKAWIEFFQERNPNKQDVTERLFRAFEISSTPSYMPESGRPTRARFMMDVNTFRFSTSADDPLFIPPSLGSWATHTECIAFYGTPSETDLRQLLTEINNIPSLIMARIHLTMQTRARISYSNPVLLIDDDLVAYAALHPSERLQSIIKIGMLTYSTNPYDDYGSKPVPAEMFFGRQSELNNLRAVKGLAVLYGGRRLGKSSLLNQIEQEMNQTPKHAGVFFSIDTINTSGDYVTSAWEFIYRALVNRKIIKPIDGPFPMEWGPIQQHIEIQLLESQRVKSLYLLIDEADNLMGCELNRQPNSVSFVSSLIHMSDNLSHACGLRTVIAGLHNMTRMANDPNSVFGKADPIALRPFSTSDDIQRGIRLITKPLAAMGYLFGPGAEDLPLRILSVCNYYPAFIQLYCKRLVENLQNNRQDKKPPFYITSEILDVVEKDNNLLTDLREKFKLNLNLDKRYKAIALILADVYYSTTETGHFTGLNVGEIREYCETYCANHFKNTGPGVYEALLDEMDKLNVVTRSGSQYMLRNPSIARMVGDRDHIGHLISELDAEPPETSRNQGERRIFMTRNHNSILFPMPVSWIRNHMNAVRSHATNSYGQLIILVGNAMSGIMDLAVVDRDEWKLQDGVFASAPGSHPSHIQKVIEQNRRGMNDVRDPKFLSIRMAAWKVSEIDEYAKLAQKAGKQGIQMILLADAARALEIAKAIESNTLKINPTTWQVVPVPPWTEDAIYFRVQENVRVAESHEALLAIKEATGGFGKEVINLCSTSLTPETALSAPTVFQNRLATNLDTFYHHVGLPPSIDRERLKEIEDFLALVNGIDRRNFSEIEEVMSEYHISDAMWQFLYWMGLIQEGPDSTWAVPRLYASLLS